MARYQQQGFSRQVPCLNDSPDEGNSSGEGQLTPPFCDFEIIANIFLYFEMITKKEEDIIIQTLIPYKPKSIGVFGSRARREQTEKSDLDLLVDLENITLFDLVDLEEELSHLLNVKVDLITEASLNKYLRPELEQEIRYILNQDDNSMEDGNS